MADSLYFSKVQLKDGTIAEVYDEVARQAVSGGTCFIGITTTALTDGASTNPIEIGGQSVTAENGNIAVYGSKEFIFADNDSRWHELGDTTALGALALKDSVSASYVPEGNVSKPNVTVNQTKATIIAMTSPGSVTTSDITEIDTEGSVISDTIKEVDVDGSVTNGTVKEMATAGNVVAGTANVPTSVTLPTLTTVLNGTTLEINWTPGSVVSGTPGTPTEVTLPTFRDASVVTDATMPTSKETSVVTGVTMPTTREVEVVTDATMPTGSEINVVSNVSAALESAPDFSGVRSTIVSQ